MFSLLFDGDCGFCAAFARRVREAAAGRVETVPFRDAERVRRLAPGLDRERLEASFHLVLPSGEIRSGPDAVPDLAELVLPGGRAAGWLLRRAPGSRALTRLAYRWISEHRW